MGHPRLTCLEEHGDSSEIYNLTLAKGESNNEEGKRSKMSGDLLREETSVADGFDERGGWSRKGQEEDR